MEYIQRRKNLSSMNKLKNRAKIYWPITNAIFLRRKTIKIILTKIRIIENVYTEYLLIDDIYDYTNSSYFPGKSGK